MNQFNWLPIPARQRKSLGQKQGSEAFVANVSVHQDWEHWCMLAQESPPLSSCPSTSQKGGHWGRVHMGSFLNSLRQEDQAARVENGARLKHPNEGGGCHWMISLMMRWGAGREGSTRDWKPKAVFQKSKPHRQLSNVKLGSQTTQHTLLPLPKDTH